MQQIIKPKSLRSFVLSLSGLFITRENPNGLSPKECFVISSLLTILKSNSTNKITSEIKLELANSLNQSLQVTTNYLGKLRRKGVITNAELHSIFFMEKILIIQKHGESTL